MRDEVAAAFRWGDCFNVDEENFELIELMRFEPSSKALPFSFLSSLYEYRATLPKSDIRNKVIKLGINSVYGKLAQKIGQKNEPPVHASPWHAAAITAWTRAKLLDAALADPEAIVMFATDGIVSTRPLPLRLSHGELGAWEGEDIPNGGAFVQSGVYHYFTEDGSAVVKSRGFRPANVAGGVEGFFTKELKDLWRDDVGEYPFPYSAYMTLGAATATREAWSRAGFWAVGQRTLDLRRAGGKRNVSSLIGERKKRARELVPTAPNCFNDAVCVNGELVISKASTPDWIYQPDPDDAGEDEQEQIAARFAWE